MKCATCKHWQFPTQSLYQGVATKGYCMEGEVKEKYPDSGCDKHIYEQKSASFREAVSHAMPIVKRERFGDMMNSNDAIADIQKAIDRMNLGNKDIPVSTLDKQAAVGDSVFIAYHQPFTVMDIRQVPGAPLQVIVADRSGTLHIFNTTDCEFRMKNE